MMALPPLITNPLPGCNHQPIISALDTAPSISPELYDRHEQAAIADQSIPSLMAYRPVTFQAHGYPVHIASPRELQRYVDHNFEAELPGLFKPNAIFPPVGYINRFTHDENDLINAIRERVCFATRQYFGRGIRPIGNLLVQTGPFRMMHHLAHFHGRSRISVFEVGPGMGYLGALLAATGHEYRSMDVTQSLYIWQSLLLQALAGDDFVEQVGNDRDRVARVAHIPWWQYIDFLHDCPLRTDIVYSNSNLGEMSNLALRHVLHISREMLSNSEIGLFAYFSTGMTEQNSREVINASLDEFGFRQIMDHPFCAFIQKGRDGKRIQEAFAEGVPHYNPTGRGGALDANSVMALRRDEAPIDVALTAWRYGWRPPYVD